MAELIGVRDIYLKNQNYLKKDLLKMMRSDNAGNIAGNYYQLLHIKTSTIICMPASLPADLTDIDEIT